MYTRKNASAGEASKTASTRRAAPTQNTDSRDEELSRRAAARKRAAQKKARERRRQRRIFLLAAGLFLSAVVMLVWAVVLMIQRSRSETTVDGTPTAPNETSYAPGSFPPASGTIPLSVDSARSLLEQAFEKDLNSVAITLENDYFNATLSRSDIGAYFDLDEALSLAASGYGTNVKATMRYDEDALMAALSRLNEKVPGHATNATMSIDYDSYTVGKTTYQKPKFVYTEGSNGMQLDAVAVQNQIGNALQSGTYQLSFSPSVTVSEPAVTVESLKKATTKLSSFHTLYYFTGTSSTAKDIMETRQGRDINISKGVSIMNVITLKPGENFSFNKKTGDRTEKKGWAMAPAIYGKDHRPEPGGGICQVSTTMYNALLLAGVEITYHRPHTIPSDYVDLGWDATVDSGHIDFKFKNNKKNTIYLFVYITKNKDSNRKKEIHVDVYGMEEPGITYKTRSELVSEDKAANPEIKYDKKQYEGYQEKTRNAHDGYVVTTYVDKYTNMALSPRLRPPPPRLPSPPRPLSPRPPLGPANQCTKTASWRIE